MSRAVPRSLATGLLLAALLLGGCATEEKRETFPDSPSEGACNSALAALIGGAIGAIVMEENRTRGAAVGAGLGALACAIINATSSQTRSTTEVEHEYRSQHGGRLPDRPTVAVYDTAYNAAGSVRGGQVARVVSNITLVPGASEPVREMREVLEVYETGRADRVMLKAEKSVEEAARAGGIRNSFDIKLPERMAEGNYPARTTLYVNGRRVGENRGTLRVLAGDRSVKSESKLQQARAHRRLL
jgi:hypothetical protein